MMTIISPRIVMNLTGNVNVALQHIEGKNDRQRKVIDI